MEGRLYKYEGIKKKLPKRWIQLHFFARSREVGRPDRIILKRIKEKVLIGGEAATSDTTEGRGNVKVKSHYEPKWSTRPELNLVSVA